MFKMEESCKIAVPRNALSFVPACVAALNNIGAEDAFIMLTTDTIENLAGKYARIAFIYSLHPIDSCIRWTQQTLLSAWVAKP